MIRLDKSQSPGCGATGFLKGLQAASSMLRSECIYAKKEVENFLTMSRTGILLQLGIDPLTQRLRSFSLSVCQVFFWFFICVFLPRQDSVDGTAVGRHHDFGVASGQGGFHHLHHPGVNHPNFRRPVATRGSHSSDTSSAYSGSDTMQVCKIILFYWSHTVRSYSMLIDGIARVFSDAQ